MIIRLYFNYILFYYNNIYWDVQNCKKIITLYILNCNITSLFETKRKFIMVCNVNKNKMAEIITFKIVSFFYPYSGHLPTCRSDICLLKKDIRDYK